MINDMLNILANDYRRCTLIALSEGTTDEDRSVRLPDNVAIGETGRERQTIELRHCHLPMLADSELIEWNRDHNKIAKGARFDDVEPLLELLVDHSDELPDEWLVTPPLR